MTRQLSSIGVGVVCLDLMPVEDAEPDLRALAEAHGCVLKAVVGWQREAQRWVFDVLSQVHTHSASTVFARTGSDLGGYTRAMVGVADVVVGGPAEVRTYPYVGYEGYVPRPGLIEVHEAGTSCD